MNLKNRPNLILFNPDQWRGDVLGHMGNAGAVTPVLDKLVTTEAVSFRNAFCQNPVCTPSRCSFMTGWYPHTRGHRTMFHMLQPHEPMLLKTLKDSGYFVWWGGKNDVVPAQNGFSDYCDVKYDVPIDADIRPNLHSYDSWRGAPNSDTFYAHYYGRLENETNSKYVPDFDHAMIEGALEFIRNAPADRPFCLYLPLRHPHPPYIVEEPWYSQIDPNQIPSRTRELPKNKPVILQGIRDLQNTASWTERRWTDLRRTYYGMCARVDAQLGRLIGGLKETGQYDTTALFFFSDHGDFTGDYGLVEKTQNTFEDCLTRIPFVIKPPIGVDVTPRVSDALVELTDLAVTVAEFAGVELEHSQFGRSLAPLLVAEGAHRDAVFCQGGRLAAEEHTQEKEHSATPDALYYPRMTMQHRIPEHGKATMLRTPTHKFVHRLYEANELYDLSSDLQEVQNLAGDPAYRDIERQLEQRLMQFYLETADIVPYQIDAR